jgi:short-subunit dehydrogenase
MEYAFISGATGGIGKAFTHSFAKRGYNLFLTGRSQEKLSELKAEIEKEFNVSVLTFACDLTSDSSRKEMIEFIKLNGVKFSRINLVAGVDIQKPFLDYTLEKVHFQLRVNVESTISLTHELLNLRCEKCKIIVISSMSGASPMPYFALYSASKSMLTNFFTALNYELKKTGVNITVVMPGGVYTRPDIIEDIKGQGLWGKLSAIRPEVVSEKSIKKSKKNKARYIPGFFNKFLYFAIKILPKKIVLNFIARRWKKISKDAF